MWSCFQTPPILPNETSCSADISATHSESSDEVIDIQGDQFQGEQEPSLKLGAWDIWALGLTTTFGGHFYLWSLLSSSGFGGLLVSTFLVFTGYTVLLLCMAELASALPFAGGAYGVARVTLGSFAGFLVACFDVYQSMFYTFLVVYILGYIIDIVVEDTKQNQPIWWVIIYASYVLAHAWGGRTYWVILKILTVTSLCLLLIYILGCIKIANFDKYAPMPAENNDTESVWFVGGPKLFFQLMPVSCFFFVGNESLNIAAYHTKNPKVDIPWGYFTSFCTVSVLTFALIFVGSSVHPGTALLPVYAIAPLTPGYMVLFDIDLKRAIALSIVPIYTSGFGFTYYYANQMHAMAKSGLVNSWLGYDVPYLKTPVNALLFGAVIGFLVGCRYHYLPALAHENLFSINLLGAVCVYFTQFISFIVFRWYYPTIKREFTSPLGIYGAVYGIVLFLLIFIILAGLESSPAIIAFGVYLFLLAVYYLTVVRYREVFSEEEKTVLFKAYLMKTNRQKQERIRLGRSRQSTTLLSIFLSFFHSPTPAVSKQANDTENALENGTDHSPRRKPGYRASDYAENSVRPIQKGEKQDGSTMRLYGASANTNVPHTASIGEESTTYDRSLELVLIPLSNKTNYASLSIYEDNTNSDHDLVPLYTTTTPPIISINNTTSNHLSAPANAINSNPNLDANLDVDLEANIPDVPESKSSSKSSASMRFSAVPAQSVEFANGSDEDH